MLCEPLLNVFIITRFLLWVLFSPPFLFVLLYNSSAYNKSPFNNYTWCCIATAGNRATIPLEIVVPHKTTGWFQKNQELRRKVNIQPALSCMKKIVHVV